MLVTHQNTRMCICNMFTKHLAKLNGTVCNGKGCWGVLEGLLMLFAGWSIVDGGNLFLHGCLLFLGKFVVAGLLKGCFCCWRGQLLLDRIFCWGRGLSMLAAVRSVVAGEGLLLLAAGDLLYRFFCYHYQIPCKLQIYRRGLGEVITTRPNQSQSSLFPALGITFPGLEQLSGSSSDRFLSVPWENSRSIS